MGITTDKESQCYVDQMRDLEMTASDFKNAFFVKLL